MKSIFAAAVASGAVLLAGAAGARKPNQGLVAPPPVDSVDLLRYAGRWYQTYGDLYENTFESRYCVTADYGLFANGTISVRNRERKGSVTGPAQGILGWAGINNRTGLDTVSGSLTVNLQGPPFPAPYDIVLLGPPTHGVFGAYEWAVVSDPFEISLFVLARNYTEFFMYYNTTVIDTLQVLGYINILNAPEATFQDGCPEWSETDLWTCDGAGTAA